jgi:hypothetical protein
MNGLPYGLREHLGFETIRVDLSASIASKSAYAMHVHWMMDHVLPEMRQAPLSLRYDVGELEQREPNRTPADEAPTTLLVILRFPNVRYCRGTL